MSFADVKQAAERFTASPVQPWPFSRRDISRAGVSISDLRAELGKFRGGVDTILKGEDRWKALAILAAAAKVADRKGRGLQTDLEHFVECQKAP